MFEDAFLATAWHVAHDLLENGWSPGFVPPASGQVQRSVVRSDHLKLVKNNDAA